MASGDSAPSTSSRGSQRRPRLGEGAQCSGTLTTKYGGRGHTVLKTKTQSVTRLKSILKDSQSREQTNGRFCVAEKNLDLHLHLDTAMFLFSALWFQHLVWVTAKMEYC